MRRFLHQLTYALVLTMLLWLTAAAAQQPATGRQKAPRLTTDDVVRPSAVLPSAEHVETHIRRDPVEPGLDRRTSLEALEAAPRAEERLLYRILRLER